MKTILITGASSGFGKLTAIDLARKGHHVFASMRNLNGKNQAAAGELRDLAKKENLKLETVELDVSDQASADAAVAEVIRSAGRIDVVVNNAGIGAAAPLETFTAEETAKVFDVNVFGVLRVNRAALPHMRKQGEGLLIHVGSIMGRIVIPFTAPYTASKFALESISESLRYELSTLGIDSVLVQPGPFPTDFGTNMIGPSDEARVGEYGELAEMPGKIFGGVAQLFEGDDAPKSEEVSQAVVDLVEQTHGERPARVIVDRFMSQGAEAVNQTSAQVQQGLLENMGLADFAQVKAKAPA